VHDDLGGLLEGRARTFKLLISTSGVSADVFVAVSACALGGTEDHCSTSVRRTIVEIYQTHRTTEIWYTVEELIASG